MKQVTAAVGIVLALLAAASSDGQPLRTPIVRGAPTLTAPTPLAPSGPRVPFSCGPRLFTYRVQGAEGIRCVELVDGASLAWYGEGRTGAGFYSHIGYAHVEGRTLVGSAADLYGSEGITGGKLDGSLVITAAAGGVNEPPPIVRVSGAWTEEWRLGAPESPVATPEPPPGCGFAQPYQVHGASGPIPGRQCALTARGQGVVWLAERGTGDRRSAYLGSARASTLLPAFAAAGSPTVRWGAIPLCGGRWAACGATVAHGDLTVTPASMVDAAGAPAAVVVRGVWNESWEPVLGDVRQAPPAELVVPSR